MAVTILEGCPALRVPLRVRHVIDGTVVAGPAERVAILPPLATEAAGQGVPLASESEAARHVDRCAVGQARWMALGAERREQALRRHVDNFERSRFQWAEAFADDHGIDCAPLIGASSGLDRVLSVAVERAAELPRDTPRGLSLWCLTHQPGGFDPVVDFFTHLLHGSAMIVLASPHAPRAPFELARIALETAMPDGTLNLLYAQDSVRLGLLRHPLVAAAHDLGQDDVGFGALGAELGKPVFRHSMVAAAQRNRARATPMNAEGVS